MGVFVQLFVSFHICCWECGCYGCHGDSPCVGHWIGILCEIRKYNFPLILRFPSFRLTHLLLSKCFIILLLIKKTLREVIWACITVNKWGGKFIVCQLME